MAHILGSDNFNFGRGARHQYRDSGAQTPTKAECLIWIALCLVFVWPLFVSSVVLFSGLTIVFLLLEGGWLGVIRSLDIFEHIERSNDRLYFFFLKRLFLCHRPVTVTLLTNNGQTKTRHKAI